VFAEYRYTSFGSTTLALPLSELSTTSTTRVSAIELGVNYKFNPRAPAGPFSRVTDASLPAAAVAPLYKVALLVLATIGLVSTSALTVAMPGKDQPEL
jgi:hypothetical protein